MWTSGRVNPQRIDLEYDGLTQTDAAILDAHFATAKGQDEHILFLRPAQRTDLHRRPLRQMRWTSTSNIGRWLAE